MLSEIVATVRHLWNYTGGNIPTHDTERGGVFIQLYDELYELTMEFKELCGNYLDQLLNVKI